MTNRMTDEELIAKYQALWFEEKEIFSIKELLEKFSKELLQSKQTDTDTLVNKFLAWELPKSVCSDMCVTYTDYPHARHGTNLLNEPEARQMIQHLFSESLLLPKLNELEERLMRIESEEVEPYMGWCDVAGCESESSSNGCYYRETGYWKLCSKHSKMARDGKPQMLMKIEAKSREASRDKKTGHLPLPPSPTQKGE